MPQIKQAAQPSTQKAVFLGVGGVLAIVLVVLATIFLLTPSPAETAKTADDLVAKGKYSEAISLLRRAQWRAFTSGDKQTLWWSLAGAASAKNDTKAAGEFYVQLLKLAPNDYAAVLASAELAERAGNKSAAISYYERALTLFKKRSSGEQSQLELDSLKSHVEELKK